MNTFNEMFKEYMYIGSLDQADQKYYYLIERYEDKVSKRLLKIKVELYEKGKEKFGEILTELMNRLNLLDLVMKDESWNGSLYHQPVILGLEHGIVFK